MTAIAKDTSPIDFASELFKGKKRPTPRSQSESTENFRSESISKPIKYMLSSVLGQPSVTSPVELRGDLEAFLKFTSVLISATDDGILTDEEANKVIELMVEGFARRRLDSALAHVLRSEDNNWYFAASKSKWLKHG